MRAERQTRWAHQVVESRRVAWLVSARDSCFASICVLRLVKAGPIRVVDQQLHVLDRVEVEAVAIPNTEHEIPVEWPTLKLLAQVRSDLGLVTRTERVCLVTLGAEATCMLDFAREQKCFEVLAQMISHHVRPVVIQGIGYEAGAVARVGESRVLTVTQTGADEVQSQRDDAIVEIALGEATLTEELAGVDARLVDVE